jgi:hypothetical protein
MNLNLMDRNVKITLLCFKQYDSQNFLNLPVGGLTIDVSINVVLYIFLLCVGFLPHLQKPIHILSHKTENTIPAIFKVYCYCRRIYLGVPQLLLDPTSYMIEKVNYRHSYFLI